MPREKTSKKTKNNIPKKIYESLKREAVSVVLSYHYHDWQTTQGKKKSTNLNDRYELTGTALLE